MYVHTLAQQDGGEKQKSSTQGKIQDKIYKTTMIIKYTFTWYRDILLDCPQIKGTPIIFG